MSAASRYTPALIIVVYIALLSAGWLVGHWFLDFIDLKTHSENEPMLSTMIMITAAVFIVASAIPFVPGAEIGLGLIVMFGGRIALLVYFSMLAALVIAFLVGRFVPLSVLARAVRALGLKRADDFIMRLTPLDGEARLSMLTDNAPRRFVPLMLRYRYVAVMLLLNLPGNSIVGGGGGIAFTAGLSGLFSFWGFITAIAVAIAPVPLFFYFLG